MLYVSGNANNTTDAGLTYSNANNEPTNANTNISSQLTFLICFKTYKRTIKINDIILA